MTKIIKMYSENRFFILFIFSAKASSIKISVEIKPNVTLKDGWVPVRAHRHSSMKETFSEKVVCENRDGLSSGWLSVRNSTLSLGLAEWLKLQMRPEFMTQLVALTTRLKPYKSLEKTT